DARARGGGGERRHGRVGPDSRRRLRRHVHAVHRRARFRRRADGHGAEPRVVLAGGARVQGQAGAPGVASRAHVRDRRRRRASMRRIRRAHVLIAAAAAALCVPASGVSSAADNSKITKIGKGEGLLNLVVWEGYTQPQWVKPVTKATGCKVKPKYG